MQKKYVSQDKHIGIENMDVLDTNDTNSTKANIVDAEICYGDDKITKNESFPGLETTLEGVVTNDSIPTKEETINISEETVVKEEDISVPFIKTEDTEDVLRFDENGLLMKVDCKFTVDEAEVNENANSEILGQEKQQTDEKLLI